MKKVIVGILSFFCIGLVLSGCNMGAKVKPINLNYPVTDSKQTEPAVFWKGDTDLKKNFERYWALRFDRQVPIRQLFSMEAPYIQEMVEESFYNNYLRSGKTPILESFQVRELVKKGTNLYAVSCAISLNNADGGKDEVYLIDSWVKVKDKWYHVLEDPIFLKL